MKRRCSLSLGGLLPKLSQYARHKLSFFWRSACRASHKKTTQTTQRLPQVYSRISSYQKFLQHTKLRQKSKHDFVKPPALVRHDFSFFPFFDQALRQTNCSKHNRRLSQYTTKKLRFHIKLCYCYLENTLIPEKNPQLQEEDFKV